MIKMLIYDLVVYVHSFLLLKVCQEIVFENIKKKATHIVVGLFSNFWWFTYIG